MSFGKKSPVIKVPSSKSRLSNDDAIYRQLSRDACCDQPRSEYLCQAEFDRIEQLRPLERFELKRVYRQLAPPMISEVDAEYGAVMLSQGGGLSTTIVRRAFSSQGPWIGKGFRPLTVTQGEGYNVFGDPYDRQIKLLMDTYIAQSNVAEGTAYILDYRQRNRGAICWLRGELRVLSENVLLGFGTFGPWRNSLRRFRRSIPFLLYRTGASVLPLSSTHAA